MTKSEFEGPWNALKAAFPIGAKTTNPEPYYNKFEYLSAPEWKALAKRAESALLSRPYANAFPSTLELENLAAQRNTVPFDDEKQDEQVTALWKEAVEKYSALDDDQKEYLNKLAEREASTLIHHLTKVIGYAPQQTIRQNLIKSAQIGTFIKRNKHLFTDKTAVDAFLEGRKNLDQFMEKNNE